MKLCFAPLKSERAFIIMHYAVIMLSFGLAYAVAFI